MYLLYPKLILPTPKSVPAPVMLSQSQVAPGQITVPPTKIPLNDAELALYSRAGASAPLNRGPLIRTVKV
jgi:hypothetical protein